jgi:hypothetical protein
MAVDKTDGDDTDAAAVAQQVETKFFNLTGELPDGRAAELLARLNAIEDRAMAELFRF